MKNKHLKIGLLIPNISSPYYASIVDTVSAYLKDLGHDLLLFSAFSNLQKEKECFDFFKDNQCDGVIVIAITLESNVLYALKKANIRVVLADNRVDAHFPAVVNDNYGGASLLFEHMIKKGCRRIGWIGGHNNTFVVKERLRAFFDVMDKHNLEVYPEDIIFGNSDFEFGYESAKELLSANKVDSIFGINDLVSLGIFKYCEEHNINIPKNLKVAGFDDIEMSSMVKVPLTTVYQNKKFLAKKACELLISEIKDPSVPMAIVLDTELIVRKSC